MEEEKKKAEERAKVEFTPEERLSALKAALEIPKGLRSGTMTVSDPDHKQLFTLQRLKFRGPDPPAFSMAVPAEGTEDPKYDLNVHRIQEEDALIASFTEDLFRLLETTGKQL